MITTNIKSIIDRQQEKGLKKYGKTVDQADLSIEEWIEHTQEEIVDALIYLECIKQKMVDKQKSDKLIDILL
tara:strand:+ start:158 stop:373 length:216 start_codon:yes stop_codon:yes gene_type:complete